MSTYSIPPSVPPSVEALLRLFHEQLAEVRFPGMDAQVLAAAVSRVADAESEVARLSLALDAAHAALRDAVELLSGKAQRALAYARVYAEDDPAVRARLESLVVAPASPPPAAAAAPPDGVERRRRGRPPKSERPALFFEEPAAADAATIQPTAATA